MIILAGIEVGKRLPIGVDDLEATGQALNGPWKRRLAIGSKPREKGADRSRRPLDNERPTTTYLSVAALPRPSLVPPWNRRSPALRGRGFSMRSMLMERIVLSNKVEKKAGLITKAGRGVARSVSGAGDQKIRAPTETDALFYNRIGAYGVLSPVVGDLVLGWFTVTSTPFWSD